MEEQLNTLLYLFIHGFQTQWYIKIESSKNVRSGRKKFENQKLFKIEFFWFLKILMREGVIPKRLSPSGCLSIVTNGRIVEELLRTTFSMLTPDDELKTRNIYIEIKLKTYICFILWNLTWNFTYFLLKMFHLEPSPNSLKIIDEGIMDADFEYL